MPDLSRVGERERLKPNSGDEPHWHRLRVGCFVGFRPSRKSGKGTWFGRAYDEGKRKYVRKRLGDYGSLAGSEIFAAAKKDAEAWADEVESGGVRQPELVTVADACRAYLKEKPGAIAEGVFRRHVFDDPIARVKLDKLRRRHLTEWRKRLSDAPALVSRSKTGEKRTKPRSPSTINRDSVPLRAALGRILPPGAPRTEAAWQEGLVPIQGATFRRKIYLDQSERRRLFEIVADEAKPFVKAMCLLPLRPGAIASLRVCDFEKRTRALTISKDKNGEPRQIFIPHQTADFLKLNIKGKEALMPIFVRGDGQPWSKDKWKHLMKDAVTKAGVHPGATAYTFRHSVITDLVLDGVPLFVVAQLAGTSAQMIEEHYGHLIQSASETALSKLAF